MSCPSVASLPQSHQHETGVLISVCNQTTTLSVSGRLVHGVPSVGFAHEAFAHAVTPRTKTVVLNLACLVKIDAAGLGFLAFAEATARSGCFRLILSNTPGFVLELLQITRLDTVLTLEGETRKVAAP
jgi:ABC-type transporter Mla MlaB component